MTLRSLAPEASASANFAIRAICSLYFSDISFLASAPAGRQAGLPRQKDGGQAISPSGRRFYITIEIFSFSVTFKSQKIEAICYDLVRFCIGGYRLSPIDVMVM